MEHCSSAYNPDIFSRPPSPCHPFVADVIPPNDVAQAMHAVQHSIAVLVALLELDEDVHAADSFEGVNLEDLLDDLLDVTRFVAHL